MDTPWTPRHLDLICAYVCGTLVLGEKENTKTMRGVLSYYRANLNYFAYGWDPEQRRICIAATPTEMLRMMSRNHDAEKYGALMDGRTARRYAAILTNNGLMVRERTRTFIQVPLVQDMNGWFASLDPGPIMSKALSAMTGRTTVPQLTDAYQVQRWLRDDPAFVNRYLPCTEGILFMIDPDPIRARTIARMVDWFGHIADRPGAVEWIAEQLGSRESEFRMRQLVQKEKTGKDLLLADIIIPKYNPKFTSYPIAQIVAAAEKRFSEAPGHVPE